ncbi:MAG TPA: glycosyltransferase family A protein, partial [Flavobacterium sp.]
NGGVSNARNVAIAHSTGEFILPLDGDDKISTNYIFELLEVFDEDPNITVAYGGGEKFGIANGLWEVAEYSLENLILSNMIHCTGMFRRSDFERIGGYDVKMHEGLEDWEFWINLLKNGGQVRKVDTARFFYRVKEVSRMTKITRGKRYRLLAYIYSKHSELYENYVNDYSKPISIDFPYSFWLSAVTYFKDDHERIRKLNKYFKFKLNSELKKTNFLQRKRLLFYWYRIGKLDFSLWDVITK